MLLALLPLLLAFPSALAQEGAPDQPLSPRERAVHLLSRLSFGPRPGEVERLLEMGEEAWIREQLAPIVDAALADRLSGFHSLSMDAATVADTYDSPPASGLTEDDRRQRARLRQLPRIEMMQSVLLRSALSKNQLKEVMCDFWRNHFNVSYTKGGSANFLITDWERNVIQAYALGNFVDLLEASAHHPAMLHYLDNASSRRPPTKQELAEIERRVRRKTGSRQRGEEAAAQLSLQRGLNENYGRELLELHTLGVDNGYKQRDVIAVAKSLTGWTWSGGRNGNWRFQFRNDMHIQEDERILGKRFKNDRNDGQAQGEAVLRMLASDRRTASFISTKLARYLLSDVPPPKLVAAVAKTFKKSGGDVPAMIRTILQSEQFWSREAFRSKFKTPFEFVVSAVRATDAEITNAVPLVATLRDMGQGIYLCDDPTGWFDTAEAWLDPGVMAVRWQFALDLASGKIQGVRIPDSFWERVPQDVPARLWQHHLTKLILLGGAGPRTRAALSAVTDRYLSLARNPDIRVLGPQLVGLLLGSPEFQQQ